MLRCDLIGGIGGLRDAVAGQVVLKLKTTAWRDCTTGLVMAPLDFLQRPNGPAPRPPTQTCSYCCRD